MNDLVKMLRDDAKMQLSVDYDTERAAMFENKAADRIEELEAEVERLTKLTKDSKIKYEISEARAIH
jgi:hypothetical protein